VANHSYGDGLNQVRLTPSEMAIMHCLVRAAGTVPAQELLQRALGYAEATSLPVVRAHIANVRRKCREAGLADPIVTMARVGYASIGMDCRE
jgi:DNA-binding response OmpR family regulator